MASIPWWALAAGAPKLLNEYVVDPIRSGYELYSGIRNDQDKQRSQAAEREVLADYAMAKSPEDVDFIRRTTTSYGPMDTATAYNLDKYGKERASQYEEEASKADLPNALSEFSSIAMEDPSQPIGTAFMRMKPESQAMLVRTLKGGLDDFTKAMSMGVGTTQQQKADREALSNLDYIYREKTPLDAYTRLSELTDVTGASPGVSKELRDDLRQHFIGTGDYHGAHKEKEFDPVTQDASTFLVAQGFDMLSPQGRKSAYQYLGSREGRDAYTSWAHKMSAARYHPHPAQVQFLGFGSDNKPVTFNPRTGTVEGNTSEGVTPKVKQRLSADDSKAITTTWSLDSDLQDIINTVKRRPDFVGPIQGNARELAAKIQNDPEFARFQQKTGRLIQIVYSLSGKTVTDSEREFFQNVLLPAIKQPDKNFLARAQEAKSMLNKSTDNWVSGLESQGYIVPKRGNKSASPSGPPVAPAGTRIKTKEGKILTSDGKGGWR